MTTKLTLSLESVVIERAKIYARKTGKSLSEIVEGYLESITSEEFEGKPSAKLKSLIGAVKLPPDFNEDKELRNALEKKYL